VLVYLLPGDANGPGTAILVPRDEAPYHLTLPRLTVRDGEPVHRHLAALGTRDIGAVPAPERTRPWRAALDDLCTWAWSAAIGPLLRDIGKWGLGRPPRLVLVPVGELATVPWHAARVRPGHHAVRDAVFSYAPSARILCDCVWRTPVDANGGSLIVGDPTGDLPDAYDEATAIRDAYHPSATLLGAGDATPAAVLAALRRTSSLLHLACHGGLGPDGSYLSLAGGEPLNASRLVEAREHKTIGLVVLAACTTGVPSGAYDEAFSIATAFLASGAATVFGSLWSVPDDATSLLMFMAHHYLSVEGLRPVDALHRAQLWMLDGGRVAPAEMPAVLARRVGAIDRDDVAAWAAFTHLGR
jgi:CHAT domain-containing protein